MTELDDEALAAGLPAYGASCISYLPLGNVKFWQRGLHMTPGPSGGHPWLRAVFCLAGLLLAGLGIVGVIMPGWPGTIFLILAAACFARSSPRLETWLVSHPRFGVALKAWRETGAISRRVKIIAIGSMAGSFLLVLLARFPPVWAIAVGAALMGSAVFVGSRPEPPNAMR